MLCISALVDYKSLQDNLMSIMPVRLVEIERLMVTEEEER